MKFCFTILKILMVNLLILFMINQSTAIVGLSNGTFNSSQHTPWEWSTTQVISTESDFDSVMPTIAVDSFNNLHTVWYDYTNYSDSGIDVDIFYKKYIASTSSWSDTEVISTESTGNSYYPEIVIDLYNNIHVVWYDYTNYNGSGIDADIFYKKYNSTTSTWSDSIVVSTESTATSLFPKIVVDTQLNLHIIWLDGTDFNGAGTDNDIFYKRYDDNSSTWGNTEIISSQSTLASTNPSLALDHNDNLYVVWEEATDVLGSGADYDIFMRKFDAIDLVWTGYQLISTESTGSSGDPTITVDKASNIHIVWADNTDILGAGSDSDIFYKKYNADTGYWESTGLITQFHNAFSSNPKIISDDHNNVHVVWDDQADIGGAGNDIDIFYTKYSVDANSWSSNIMLSTPSNSNSFCPSITIDGNDFLHVVWYDLTNIDNNGFDFDIFYRSYSGVPYAPVVRNITPNPAVDSVGITWSLGIGATSYNIYRSTEPIYDLTGLSSYVTTENLYYIDHFDESSYYYYVVTGVNRLGEGGPSNMVYVEVNIPVDPTTIIIEDNQTITVDNFQTLTEFTGEEVYFPAFWFVSIFISMVILKRRGSRSLLSNNS